MSTSNPNEPHNRQNFSGSGETQVREMYVLMQQNNRTLEAMVVYLRNTNMVLNPNGPPGVQNESIIKIVKKLRDENIKVTDKWGAYMSLRGGAMQFTDLTKPTPDYHDLDTILDEIMQIYRAQLQRLNNNVYPTANLDEDGHLAHFAMINMLYNQKKLYQIVKAMQIQENTGTSALGNFIVSNSLDFEDQEVDIFDFSNVM